ncbi:hypothetical protein ACTJIV_20325, partial [Chryseobacterium sp. 22532]|uniref:hypothetical protein n=1 Tax=Chryseobacterium sp. 22532 TaxID=3453938 RepID=UPI003F84C55E
MKKERWVVWNGNWLCFYPGILTIEVERKKLLDIKPEKFAVKTILNTRDEFPQISQIVESYVVMIRPPSRLS